MTQPDTWMAPARCPEPRLQCRYRRSPGAWHTGLAVRLTAYDGPVLEVEVEVPGHWGRLRVRLWYSQAMLRRGWDRWHAETLAGEHRGITLNVTDSSSEAA
jgi:hypothetical protein